MADQPCLCLLRMGTPELAILTTGIVGLGAPSIAAFFQWLRDKGGAERERWSKDREELRTLVDELCAATYQHTLLLTSLEAWMHRSFLGLPNEKTGPSTGATRRELYTLNARLVVRRGREDDLVRILGAYLKLTDEAIKEIGDLWMANEPFDYGDEQLAVRAHEYWAAHEAFIDASKRLLDSK
jgi:hypothetical protein